MSLTNKDYLNWVEKQLNDYWDSDILNVDIANVVAGACARLLSLIESKQQTIDQALKFMEKHCGTLEKPKVLNGYGQFELYEILKQGQ